MPAHSICPASIPSFSGNCTSAFLSKSTPLLSSVCHHLWILIEDIKLLGQSYNAWLLTAIAVARVFAFSCVSSLSPFPKGNANRVEGHLHTQWGAAGTQASSRTVRMPTLCSRRRHGLYFPRLFAIQTSLKK